MIVTVSGLPGAGTTTVSRSTAMVLGIEHVDAGAIFRTMAADRGMSLAEFGAYARDHLEVDVELDTRMADRGRHGDCLLEGRLSGWVAAVEQLDALKVWVACSEEVRAARVAGREGVTVEAAREQNRARQALDADRYRRIYGIALDDLAPYDVVLDSDHHEPPALVDTIVAAARERALGE